MGGEVHGDQNRGKGEVKEILEWKGGKNEWKGSPPLREGELLLIWLTMLFLFLVFLLIFFVLRIPPPALLSLLSVSFLSPFWLCNISPLQPVYRCHKL